MILIALLALINSGSGADDNVGQGFFVDGPGGYLPNGDFVNDNTDYAPTISIDHEGSSDYLTEYNDLLSILSYWENYWETYF